MSETNNKQNQQNKPVMPMGGMRGGMMGGGGEKAKNFKGTMKQLIEYLRSHWTKLIFVFIFAVIGTVFSIISPKIMGQMTDELVTDFINQKVYDGIISQMPDFVVIQPGTTGEQLVSKIPTDILKEIPQDRLQSFRNLSDVSKRPEIDWTVLANFAILLIGLFLLGTLFTYIQGWLTTDVTQKVTYKMRREIFEKINRMPIKYFDSHVFGDVLSRVTNDVDTISQSLNQVMTQLITSVVTIIGILIMMLTISWQMTLIALVALPLSFAFIGIILKNSQKYFKSQQDGLGKLNGHIEEMYAGHNIVKVFNGEQKSLEVFDDTNKTLYHSAWKAQFFSSLMWPIMNLIGNLDYVAVALLGGKLAIEGTLTIGDIQAFIQYLRQFNQPILQTANIASLMQSTTAAAERVFEFLKEEEETADKSVETNFKFVSTSESNNIGHVEFRNVEFGYSKDKKIIKNFSANIKSGQKIAIVGPTGAGKTTIINLLMRFYDVDSGAILIDGVDIRDVKRESLRNMFGMVLQDTWLFNGTIKENLAYGKVNATDEEIFAAAKATHLDHFIHSLPNGYDFILNEESSNISQGEKQLLTIARAMIKNPPMLILDEATSNVDTRTEILIQKAMENLMKGRTSFVIAHRLSTIKGADLILVMRDGNIVEQGNHSELLKLNGFYASLYNSQFVEGE